MLQMYNRTRCLYDSKYWLFNRYSIHDMHCGQFVNYHITEWDHGSIFHIVCEMQIFSTIFIAVFSTKLSLRQIMSRVTCNKPNFSHRLQRSTAANCPEEIFSVWNPPIRITRLQPNFRNQISEKRRKSSHRQRQRKWGQTLQVLD